MTHKQSKKREETLVAIIESMTPEKRCSQCFETKKPGGHQAFVLQLIVRELPQNFRIEKLIDEQPLEGGTFCDYECLAKWLKEKVK